MGAGASSAETRRTPPATPQGRFLANGGNINGPPPGRPSAAGKGDGRRKGNDPREASRAATSSETVMRQKVEARRRAAASGVLGDEEDLRVLTRNADPISLKILQLVQDAEALPAEKAADRIGLLQQCYPLLQQVPTDRFDHLAMMVYQKEGDVYNKSSDIASAKATYTRAITLAEKRVARRDKDLYMVLKRYVLSMVAMARIWYEHERDMMGFNFVDQKHPHVAAVDPDADDAESIASSLSSLESTLSDGGSVFSLNQEVLKAMAPRLPRSQTGPAFRRLHMRAPRLLNGTQFTREDDFVLYSRMTRELIASPCELLLLRCCQVVEIGLNCQSELLIPPMIELSQIYEDLELYSRALLLVRKCLGTLCNVYDYDHPWVIELTAREARLAALLEEQLREEAATKIQSVWRMHRAMCDLEDALGHPVKRHVWIPRKYRTTPELNFLDDFVDDMPVAEEEEEEEEEEEPIEEDVIELPYVPEEQRDDVGRAYPPPADRYPPQPETPPPPPPPMTVYDPTVHEGEVVTYTTMVPNARVVGTTQDTETDTHVQPTEFGDVMTVRTTTVTKTVTENLDSDDEQQEGSAPPRQLPSASPSSLSAPRCPRCHQEQPPPSCAQCGHCFAPPSCVNCYRTLPFPPPRDRDAGASAWPQGPNEPAAPEQLPVCAACGTMQPPLPPVPLRCPECHAAQPSGTPPCPFCGCGQPESPGHAAPNSGAAAMPTPTRCPHCNLAQPPPACEHCGYIIAPPHCPQCYAAQPYAAPTADGHPQDSHPLRCASCGLQQPPHRRHGAQPPELCPQCTAQLPSQPRPCPYCAFGEPPSEDDFGAASAPAAELAAMPAPARCPTCHMSQPPLTCGRCAGVLPRPVCPQCRAEQSYPSPCTGPHPAGPNCKHCGCPQQRPEDWRVACPHCHAPRPMQHASPCPFCGFGDDDPAHHDTHQGALPLAPRRPSSQPVNDGYSRGPTGRRSPFGNLLTHSHDAQQQLALLPPRPSSHSTPAPPPVASSAALVPVRTSMTTTAVDGAAERRNSVNYTIEKTRITRRYGNEDDFTATGESNSDVQSSLSITAPSGLILPHIRNGSGAQVQREVKRSSDGRVKTVTQTTTRRHGGASAPGSAGPAETSETLRRVPVGGYATTGSKPRRAWESRH